MLRSQRESDESMRLLWPDEVAEILGVPVTTLYGWRYRQIGPTALKVGRHLRYRREDIERFISESSDISEPN